MVAAITTAPLALVHLLGIHAGLPVRAVVPAVHLGDTIIVRHLLDHLLLRPGVLARDGAMWLKIVRHLLLRPGVLARVGAMWLIPPCAAQRQQGGRAHLRVIPPTARISVPVQKLPSLVIHLSGCLG